MSRSARRRRRVPWSASSAGVLAVAVLLAANSPHPVAGPRQAVTPVASASTASAPSWNRNVSCRATVTTLAAVLGSKRSARGGATFGGGGFKPGVPDKRDISPPCTVNGVATLVELHGVRAGSCTKINKDGDWTCSLVDPRRASGDLNRIHIETDAKLRAKGDWTVPPGGTLLDVQGFVYWDPGHVDAAFHNHSGWELHSFTAWRPAF